MATTKKKAGRDEPKETRSEEAQRKWQEIRERDGDMIGTCSVFRIVQGKREEQLGNVSVDDLGDDPYELLRERWGGGEYVVCTRNEAGVYMAGTRVHYHLAGAPKDPKAVEKDGELERLEKRLEKLAEGGSKDSAVMVELIRQSSKRPPATDFAPIITAVGTMLAPVLAALVKRPDPPEPPPPPPTALEQIETLGAVLTLAREMNPPADGIAGLAKTMGEPIAKLVDAHLSGDKGLAPGAGAPAQPPNAEAGVARPGWYQFLSPIVPQALRWAGAEKDAELRGDFIIDELRDDQLGPVYRVLVDPAFRDEFFREFPEAQPHAEWFDVLFRRIVSGIVPPEELEAAEELERETGTAPDGEEGVETPVADVTDPGQVEGAETRSLG